MSGKHGGDAGGGKNPPPDPFAALGGLGDLPAGPAPRETATTDPVAKTSKRGQNMNRGRVDIIRQSRGGKGITVAKNFIGISLTEKQELAKKMQKSFGVGGTVKDGCIEIQGDKRDEMKRILTEAGFRPVFAGG